MNLIFIDPKCPAAYDSEMLRTRGLGGTEATVIRIAQALSGEHRISVLQHNRVQALQESENLAFLPMTMLEREVARADHVFFIQKAQYIDRVVRHSRARLWLWLHNYLKEEVPYFWQDHLRYRLGVICVSRTHAEHTRRYLRRLPLYWASLGMLGRGGLLYLHNPVADTLAPDPAVQRDPFKLVFFSSPIKGIEQVLAVFRDAHARDPRLTLYVADPGYLKHLDPALLEGPGIVRLGSLPQHEVLRHVREAMCVFYPQRKRPETFGLVYAEANAVGTPVLAHDFGAAREVLAESNPPIDASSTELVLATLRQWVEHGAPQPQRKPEFALEQVRRQWQAFLHAPEAFQRRQRYAA